MDNWQQRLWKIKKIINTIFQHFTPEVTAELLGCIASQDCGVKWIIGNKDYGKSKKS